MKKFLIISAGILVLGILAGILIYNKPHRSIAKSSPDYTLTSRELFTVFEADEASANEKYLDKILQVTGKVTASKTDEEGITSITLEGEGMMFGVICKLDTSTDHKRKDFPDGEEVTLRGICSGMLMDVVLVRCVEI